jgi:hypothetical protein
MLTCPEHGLPVERHEDESPGLRMPRRTTVWYGCDEGCHLSGSELVDD